MRLRTAIGEGAVDKPRFSYELLEDATLEGELAALAAVYAFALERHEHKQTAAEVGDGKNGAEVTHSDIPSEEPSADRGSG